MIKFLKKIISQKIKNKLVLYLHKGHTYVCPFCKYHSKDHYFIGEDFDILSEKKVIGGSKRKAGCFKCGSSDRERLLWVYLNYKTPLFQSPEKAILHIAPEKNLSKYIQTLSFKKYICGDYFTEGYSYPNYVKNINLLNLDFTDNSFDFIICNHVLEHIQDDKRAMQELYRVLKSSGIAIVQVPISKNSIKTYEDFEIIEPKARALAFGQFDHVRIYGQDYVNRLSSVGFEVQRINISKNYATFGLNEEEDIFIVQKT